MQSERPNFSGVSGKSICALGGVGLRFPQGRQTDGGCLQCLKTWLHLKKRKALRQSERPACSCRIFRACLTAAPRAHARPPVVYGSDAEPSCVKLIHARGAPVKASGTSRLRVKKPVQGETGVSVKADTAAPFRYKTYRCVNTGRTSLPQAVARTSLCEDVIVRLHLRRWPHRWNAANTSVRVDLEQICAPYLSQKMRICPGGCEMHFGVGTRRVILKTT